MIDRPGESKNDSRFVVICSVDTSALPLWLLWLLLYSHTKGTAAATRCEQPESILLLLVWMKLDFNGKDYRSYVKSFFQWKSHAMAKQLFTYTQTLVETNMLSLTISSLFGQQQSLQLVPVQLWNVQVSLCPCIFCIFLYKETGLWCLTGQTR